MEKEVVADVELLKNNISVTERAILDDVAPETYILFKEIGRQHVDV